MEARFNQGESKYEKGLDSGGTQCGDGQPSGTYKGCTSHLIFPCATVQNPPKALIPPRLLTYQMQDAKTP